MKIGTGLFSDVFRGTWRGRTVAIKVLADAAPRELFKREISNWRALSHKNVLPLLGASSVSGDVPVFFVNPYYRNGGLVTFLKGRDSLAGVNVPKMLYETACGMVYLHQNDVLHGDLKVRRRAFTGVS